MSVGSTFFAKFKKVIALVGSNREGERHAAADQAYRMCDENDLSVLEALDGAFGNDAGADELRRQIEELEEDNRKLAEAVNVLNAQVQAIPQDAGKQMLRKFWSYAQVRLIVALLEASGYFWVLPEFCRWFHLGDGGWVGFLQGFYAVGVMFFLWQWACAEYIRSGAGVVALKSAAIVAGLAVALQVPPYDPALACFEIAATGALTITNGASWLADELAHSNNEVFATLRSWFA